MVRVYPSSHIELSKQEFSLRPGFVLMPILQPASRVARAAASLATVLQVGSSKLDVVHMPRDDDAW